MRVNTASIQFQIKGIGLIGEMCNASFIAG